MDLSNNTTYVVNFWATWCSPCIKELPHFEYVNEKYSSKNVKVFLVSLDFPSEIESKLQHYDHLEKDILKFLQVIKFFKKKRHCELNVW